MSSMIVGKRLLCAASLIALFAAPPALAGMTAQEAARLGKDLTPVGADASGNKAGTIPAWTGGMTKPPPGYDRASGEFVNPFANEQPLYTITGANADQYKDKLAPGQIALLKRYPTYKMRVYPSHRTAAQSASVYETIKMEGQKAELAEGGNGVLNVHATPVPFPVPKSGVEVIWNHIMYNRGATFIRYSTEFPVHTNGSFTPLKRTEWRAVASALDGAEPNRLSYYRNVTTAPSSIAGEATLVHEPLDQAKEPRLAWTYNPGQRRVLRAPSVAHDSPGTGTDGLRTVDDYDGFNGSPERFDWKLVGKKEMLIGYNNYKLNDKGLKYKDIIKETGIDQDLVRYELHRVWHVQATLKPGARHVYSRRELMHDYDRLLPDYAANVLYDLQSRRYLVHRLLNEERPSEYNVPMKLSQFTPDALRRGN